MLLLIILVVGISICLGWALTNQRFHLSIILLALVLILLVLLYRRLTLTNREILFFFKALQNEDSSIMYQDKHRSKLIDELSSYMNQLNLNFREMKVDQELREQYFNRILGNLSGGLLVLTKTGHVNHINQQALSLFKLSQLTHVKALKGVDQKLYKVIEGIKPGSKSNFKALGLQCTGINLRGEDVRIITLQDLSIEMEQKEIDDWIRLIRVMSHEIMNSLAPITSISTTLKELWDQEGLQDEGADPKVNQTIKGLDAIAEQSEGLTTFFESYRVLSRIPDPNKKEFQLCHMLDKLDTLVFHDEINRDKKISFSCDDPGLKLLADEQMISQVMLNLIKNASRALEGSDEAKIEIKARTSEEGKLELSVLDNGPGIPHEIAAEIFLPFFTTHEKGNGVGLSYSRQVMNLHGGQIRFSSRPGKTEFTLSFA